MWLEQVLRESEASAGPYELNISDFLKKNLFRFESASCWDVDPPICIGVSVLITLRSVLGECLMMCVHGCS